MTEDEIDAIKPGEEFFNTSALPKREAIGYGLVGLWEKNVNAYLTWNSFAREWRFRVHSSRPPGGVEPEQESAHTKEEAIEGLKNYLRKHERDR